MDERSFCAGVFAFFPFRGMIDLRMEESERKGGGGGGVCFHVPCLD